MMNIDTYKVHHGVQTSGGEVPEVPQSPKIQLYMLLSVLQLQNPAGFMTYKGTVILQKDPFRNTHNCIIMFMTG